MGNVGGMSGRDAEGARVVAGSVSGGVGGDLEFLSELDQFKSGRARR